MASGNSGGGLTMQVYTAEQVDGLLNPILKRMAQLEQEIRDLRAVTPGGVWMDRKQAMQYLKCGPTKLWQIQQSGSIVISMNGKKPMYSRESLESYLLGKSNDPEIIKSDLKKIFS